MPRSTDDDITAPRPRPTREQRMMQRRLALLTMSRQLGEVVEAQVVNDAPFAYEVVHRTSTVEYNEYYSVTIYNRTTDKSVQFAWDAQLLLDMQAAACDAVRHKVSSMIEATKKDDTHE